MKKTLSASILGLLFTLSALGASVIELKNGDRISGEVISKDAESVRISTELLGELTIPASSIVALAEDTKEVAAAEPPPPPPPPPAPLPPPQEEKAHSFIPGMNGLRTASASFLRMINIWEEWKSNLSVSLSLLSGQTDSRSTNVSFNTERKWTKQSLRFEVTQEYEVNKTDGVRSVTRDRFKATGRYRHDISKSMFFQSDTQYMYARVKGIDHDIRQSLGLGWFLVQSDKLSVSLTPSVTTQYTVLNGESQDVACSPTIYEEVVYKWSDTVNVRQEASALFPVNGDADPSYHFAAIFQNKFMENLSFNVEYLFDYDGAVAEDVDASQHSLRLGLGLSF
ncbi:MAG: DUF481 domain-containing protein [Opitutales bacterium]|nr:DUF481 domain-containing protein [Opitutales bacterium]